MVGVVVVVVVEFRKVWGLLMDLLLCVMDRVLFLFCLVLVVV